MPSAPSSLNFNQDISNGILDALGQPDRIDATLLERLLTKLGDKLSLLSGPGGVDRDFNVEAHAIETILGAMRGNVPCIVVDVPNMWAPWIKYTLIHADQVIITATPELASLRNAKNLIDLLKQARPNDAAPKLILNQVGVPKRPEIPAAEFAKAIGVRPGLRHSLRRADLRHGAEQRSDGLRSGPEVQGGRVAGQLHSVGCRHG